MKERLERCTREMLTQLCSVFDITNTNAFYGKNKVVYFCIMFLFILYSRSFYNLILSPLIESDYMQKEIIELLLDFLEAPHDAATEETESSHREVYRNYFYLCCC